MFEDKQINFIQKMSTVQKMLTKDVHSVPDLLVFKQYYGVPNAMTFQHHKGCANQKHPTNV